MTRSLRCLGIFSFWAIVVACNSTGTRPLQAQPKPAAVPPSYPTLTTPATLGTKPGNTVEVTLTGTNLLDATSVWTSLPSQTTILPDQKDATKLKVKFVIPADAAVGFHTFRVATKAGMTNVRPFVIDDLPEVEEKPGNTKKEMAQVVVAPCVILGSAAAESADYFRVPVKTGQPITIEAVGRRLGSTIDPVIILSDAKGQEIPGLYADDTPGLQTDARVTYTSPSDGEIIVEIRDTTYRGGADYTYRLRIGNFAGATTAFPLAVERGKKTDVGFAGPGLDGVKPVSVTAAAGVEVVNITPLRAGGQSGWPVPVLAHDYPESTEIEPNNEIAKANALPLPGGVSAKFAEKSDIDFYKVTGKKGQKLLLSVLTYELNAPTEVFLRVLDAKGAELAKSNPQQAGVRLEYTPAADGDFFVACEQTNYTSGPNEVYHLSVQPFAPDFTITLGLDRIDIPMGTVGRLPINTIVRVNGFAAPVELSIVGIDGITGTLTIPAAANPQPPTPLFMPINAKPGMKLGAYVGKILATATIDGKPVTRIVASIDGAKIALGGMPNPPQEVTTQVAVAITPEPLYTLELKLDAVTIVKGGVLKGKIVAKRGDKFTEEIVIAAVTVPAMSVPKLVPIKKGESEALIELSVPATVPAGATAVQFKGTAKVNGKEVVINSAPLTITVTEPPKK